MIRAKGDDGSAGRHCLDQDEPERLRPINREKQGCCPAEEGIFVRIADLADEVDERVVQQRFDGALEVHLVHRIDLGRNTQRAPLSL